LSFPFPISSCFLSCQPASQPAPLIFFLINQFYKIIITFAAWSTNSWAQVNGRCTCLLTHQDWLTVLGCFFSSLSLKKLSLNSYWPSAYGSLFEVTWYCITIIIIIYKKNTLKLMAKNTMTMRIVIVFYNIFSFFKKNWFFLFWSLFFISIYFFDVVFI
jgi:hypothetical protein